MKIQRVSALMQHNHKHDRVEGGLPIYDKPAVYDYILNYKHNDIIPLSLTSLDVNTYLAAESSFTFDKWLKVLPNLKELCLHQMDIDVIATTAGKDDSDEELNLMTIQNMDQELLPPWLVLFTMESYQLTFEKLNIGNFYYFFQHSGSYYTAKKLTVNELKLSNTFTTIQEYDDNFKVHIVVNCQLVDIVLFDYE